MVNHAYNLIRQYKLNDGINKVFIDGSQPGSLKYAISEYAQYKHFVERAKQVTGHCICI